MVLPIIAAGAAGAARAGVAVAKTGTKIVRKSVSTSIKVGQKSVRKSGEENKDKGKNNHNIQRVQRGFVAINTASKQAQTNNKIMRVPTKKNLRRLRRNTIVAKDNKVFRPHHLSKKKGVLQKLHAVKKLGAFSAGSMLSIAIWIGILQLLLGILSIFSFMAEEATIFGIPIGYVLPGETFGWTFWGLSTIFALIGYFIIVPFFMASGLRPLHGFNRFLIFTLCFTFDFVPLLNIFPWMALWVLSITLSNVAQLLSKK